MIAIFLPKLVNRYELLNKGRNSYGGGAMLDDLL